MQIHIGFIELLDTMMAYEEMNFHMGQTAHVIGQPMRLTCCICN
jgi:hypothetical protein